MLKVTEKNEVPTSLKGIVSCLKELHKTCVSIYDNIKTILLTPKLYNRQVNEDDIIEYIRDFDIGKYFQDESVLDSAIYQTCKRIKENSFNYPKKINEFNKNLLTIKKNFLVTKKIFDLDEQNNLFNIENFFCHLAP